MSEGTTVPAALVAYLRKGLLVELGSAAECLSILTIDGVLINEPAYRSASWSIDATRALLEEIGVVEPAAQEDIELGSDDYPFLVFKVLESEHQAQAMRLQDAEASGVWLPVEKSRALDALVAVLREQMAKTAQVRREQQHLCSTASERTSLTRARSRPQRIDGPNRRR